MTFMMIVKTDRNSEAGVMPSMADAETEAMFEAEDFGEEFTPERREREKRMRAELAAKQS